MNDVYFMMIIIMASQLLNFVLKLFGDFKTIIKLNKINENYNTCTGKIGSLGD